MRCFDPTFDSSSPNHEMDWTGSALETRCHASTVPVYDAVGSSRLYVRRRKPEWAVMHDGRTEPPLPHILIVRGRYGDGSSPVNIWPGHPNKITLAISPKKK